jgi:hypothetical protein
MALFFALINPTGNKKNGYSGDCSLADRMDRVYEKD